MTVTETSADFCRSQKEKLWELLGLEEINPATINDRGGAKILGDSVQHIGKIKGLRRDRSLLF
jgi:hypothetical protein